MKNFIVIMFIILCFGVLLFDDGIGDSSSTEVTKILKAKEQVKSMLNYPNTADFHDMSTRVNGNNVYLKVDAANAFGVVRTHEFNIKVR